ncbi:MAG: hypothetical protein Q9227_000241 [Pyrenula ochraceoflavens]
MRSTTSLLSLLTVSKLALSQSTASLFIPGADQQSLVAQVLSSHASTTTYIVQCPTTASSASASATSASTTDSPDSPDTPDDPSSPIDGDADDSSDDCGFPLPFQFVAAPNSVAYSITYPGLYASVECSLGGTTTGVCTETFSGTEVNGQGTSTTTLASSDITLFPIPLTTGLSLVDVKTNSDGTFTTVPAAKGSSGSASASKTGAMASQTGSSSGMMTSASGSSSSGASAASGSSSGASGSSASTGGLPRITAAPKWVVGGAAAAMAVLAA